MPRVSRGPDFSWRKNSLAGSRPILVSSPPQENISFCPSGKSSLQARAVPPHKRGARDRHERGVRDAVDASGAQDERARGGRRSRVVLTPRRWRQALKKLRFSGAMVATSRLTRESTKETVKTIAQGRPD